MCGKFWGGPFCLLLIFIRCSAFGQSSQRQRPHERFDVPGPPVTTAMANAAYIHTLAKLRAANRNQSCSEFPRERCVDGLFTAPFPPALASSDLEPGQTWKNPAEISSLISDDDFSWAPSDSVAGSAGLLQKYRSLANSGMLFACEGPEIKTANRDCKFISYSSSQPNLLISCFVDEPNDPPEGCAPLALSEFGRDWISIRTKEPEEIGGPADDYQLQIFSTNRSMTTRILDALAAGFSLSPLTLRISSLADGVKGVSEYRASQVLNGWREYVVVRTSIDNVVCVDGAVSDSARGNPSLRSPYCLQYNFQMWINRQNTTISSDWHRPSETQEKVYQHAIETVLHERLSHLCATPLWRTDNILRCD